jgi:hypothetical protein
MPGQTTLTAEELADLATVPRDAHVLQAALQCERQAGHFGLHGATAQSYSGKFGPFEYWLTWARASAGSSSTGRTLDGSPVGGLC